MDTKQVIVIRKDLKMRRGKECAQSSHATMSFLTRQIQNNSSGNQQSKGRRRPRAMMRFGPLLVPFRLASSCHKNHHHSFTDDPQSFDQDIDSQRSQVQQHTYTGLLSECLLQERDLQWSIISPMTSKHLTKTLTYKDSKPSSLCVLVFFLSV